MTAAVAIEVQADRPPADRQQSSTAPSAGSVIDPSSRSLSCRGRKYSCLRYRLTPRRGRPLAPALRVRRRRRAPCEHAQPAPAVPTPWPPSPAASAPAPPAKGRNSKGSVSSLKGEMQRWSRLPQTEGQKGQTASKAQVGAL